jgi:hypothetical protein
MTIDSPFRNVDRERLIHPPEAIAAFIRHLGLRNYRGEEKRSKPRRQVTAPLIVQPLNEKSQPLGEPFRALTRDISTEGIGFLHTRKVDAPLAALEIENPQAPDQSKMQILVEVRRCNAIHATLFEIGCRFVMRLETGSESPPSQ